LALQSYFDASPLVCFKQFVQLTQRHQTGPN
jgi:hypothetical protein